MSSDTNLEGSINFFESNFELCIFHVFAHSRMIGTEKTTRCYQSSSPTARLTRPVTLQGRFLFTVLDTFNDSCDAAPSSTQLERFSWPGSMDAFPVSNLSISCCNLISLHCVLYTMVVENKSMSSVQDISYNI